MNSVPVTCPEDSSFGVGRGPEGASWWTPAKVGIAVALARLAAMNSGRSLNLLCSVGIHALVDNVCRLDVARSAEMSASPGLIQLLQGLSTKGQRSRCGQPVDIDRAIGLTRGASYLRLARLFGQPTCLQNVDVHV